MRKVLAPVMKIVQPPIQFAQSLASVNVSATSREMKSAGEEGKVFAQTVDPQMKKPLNKEVMALNKEAMALKKEAMAWNREAMGIKMKSRALATPMRTVQPQIPSALNLGFASANATSQEMLSAGVKEIVSVVEKKLERKKEQV